MRSSKPPPPLPCRTVEGGMSQPPVDGLPPRVGPAAAGLDAPVAPGRPHPAAGGGGDPRRLEPRVGVPPRHGRRAPDRGAGRPLPHHGLQAGVADDQVAPKVYSGGQILVFAQ